MRRRAFSLAATLFALNVLPMASAWGSTIDQSGKPNALVYNSDAAALNFPGSPLQGFSFNLTPLYLGPFAPPDNLGAAPSSFLVTGNTFYNFAGDPTLAIFELDISPEPVSPEPVNSASADAPTVVPEPGAGLLLVSGLALASLSAIGGMRGSKAR